MTDRWTAIRHCAQKVLEQYEDAAMACGKPPAFSEECGSCAVLKDIARLGLLDAYCIFNDQGLPDNVFGRINLHERTIAICAQLDIAHQSLVTAHAIAHIALQHPPGLLRQKAKDQKDEEEQRDESAIEDDLTTEDAIEGDPPAPL